MKGHLQIEEQSNVHNWTVHRGDVHQVQHLQHRRTAGVQHLVEQMIGVVTVEH